MSKKSAAELDLVRARVVGSFKKARRRALDAIPEFKSFSERERRQLRKGPQTLADILSGTVNGKSDPTEGLFQRARANATAQGTEGKTASSLEAVRREILDWASFNPTKAPSDVILFVTVRLYELLIELAEESGREKGGQAKAHRTQRRAYKSQLKSAAEKCWRSHPDRSLLQIAQRVRSGTPSCWDSRRRP